MDSIVSLPFPTALTRGELFSLLLELTWYLLLLA
jgi:hypothetical protein